MTHVLVIGCGIVGAAIAYELSGIAGLTITVLDPHPPAQGSTGAALGVLMAAISQKLKGRLLRLRLQSLQRYHTLIPELEAKLNQPIPFNRAGILKLGYSESEVAQWQTLISTRAKQGWVLEALDRSQLQARYPQINTTSVLGSLHSPSDRQVHPQLLTQGLVQAAQQQGATFCFGESAIALHPENSPQRSMRVSTSTREIKADWVVLSAGVETTPLLRSLEYPLEIHPVLGQALKVYAPEALKSQLGSEPVITGDDIHVVPLGNQTYWVGATVEFGADGQPPAPDPDGLTTVLQRATEFYPALATGQIQETWMGLRPRPFGRPAPIIETLPNCPSLILATGHYRNGVLLAPATALQVKALILSQT